MSDGKLQTLTTYPGWTVISYMVIIGLQFIVKPFCFEVVKTDLGDKKLRLQKKAWPC